MFVVLPLGILFGTWLGNKLGASATIMLLWPFPVLVLHGIQYGQGGDVALVSACSASLASLPTVFSWAVPYFLLSKALERTTLSKSIQVATCLVGGVTASALMLRVVAEPWRALASNLGVLTLACLALVVSAQASMWLGKDARRPLPATATRANVAGRVITILIILAVLTATHGRDDSLSLSTHMVLMSVPRMTMELTVSTHIGRDATTARQVLWGLPLETLSPIGWCLGILWLSEPLGVPSAIALSAAWTVIYTGALAWLFVRRFGVLADRLAE